ncbi:hypothetical protein CB1_001530001 [Camelus ferus]|nr:hypothetical protein CB1_001530001 [Camelus ferus]
MPMWMNSTEGQRLWNAWKPWLQCLSMVSTFFAVCALVMFFQEMAIQLDDFSAYFTPMGHGVGEGGNQQQQNNGLAISCPDKVDFLCSPSSLADIFCLFPVLVELVMSTFSALGQLTVAVTATVGTCISVLLVPVFLVCFQGYYAVALTHQKLMPSGIL